ncbi:MAG: glycerol-3-phosphate acyltransferase [Actinobacteria bacterium]|nr:glycerol-3-phosphate acyltransferase [Actinomycetota bacterium]
MTVLLAVALLGVLLGSVPVALLVARRHGVDLRAVGDGNPGAWNALDHLGARRAWPAFVGDGLKGTVAGAVGWVAGGALVDGAPWPGSPELLGAYVGVAGAMVGHAFPLFARLRGGKSVMTFVGGAFVLCLPAAAIALGVCVLVSSVGRSFAVGARVAVVLFPVLQLGLASVEAVMATGLLMTIIGARFLVAGGAPAQAS